MLLASPRSAPRPVCLTIAEAAALLEPPVTARRLRAIIRALCIQPCGQKRTGKPGHPAPLYDAAEIMRLHSAISPWLHAE